ncbi:MAG TPA: cyclic nucleotide-binding domain-containing protein [Chthonomonadales bacterium]|nr:cyclic nucleotide-binding domain-containing protein [Chthonomonadales bacterium]
MATVPSSLAEHPFCDGLQPEYLEFIASCASEVSFRPGKVIAREGDPADRAYLILEGRVALEAFQLQVGPVVIQTIGPGDALGWSWLVPPYKWHLDARALDHTKVITLDGQTLRERCEADPGLGYQILKRVAVVLEQRLQASRLRLLDAYGRR